MPYIKKQVNAGKVLKKELVYRGKVENRTKVSPKLLKKCIEENPVVNDLIGKLAEQIADEVITELLEENPSVAEGDTSL